MEKIQFHSNDGIAKKAEGTKVEFNVKGNSFQDYNGNIYQGEIQLNFSYINALESNQLESFPDFKARSLNGVVQQIESQGAIEIQFVGSKYQIYH